MPVCQPATIISLSSDAQPLSLAAHPPSDSASAYAAILRTSNQLARPLALDISMHAPLIGAGGVAAYLTRLDQEMTLLSQQLHPSRKVHQLHWTGSSSTLLSLSQMSELVDHIAGHFSLADNTHLDFTVDLDPQDANLLMLRHLQALGINRLNFAAVGLNAEIQRSIGCSQPRSLLEPLVDEAQRLGMHSLSLDLWVCLPGQTVQRLTNALKQLIELTPSRLRLFDFHYNPVQFPAHKVPTASPVDTIKQLHQAARSVLGEAGYVAIASQPYGQQLYARDGEALDDALEEQYRRLTSDRLGIGLGATSRLENVQTNNLDQPKNYTAALDAGLLPTA